MSQLNFRIRRKLYNVQYVYNTVFVTSNNEWKSDIEIIDYLHRKKNTQPTELNHFDLIWNWMPVRIYLRDWDLDSDLALAFSTSLRTTYKSYNWQERQYW